MYDAVEKHWRAAAWMLERKCPEEFGRRKPQTYTLRDVREIVDRLMEFEAMEAELNEQRQQHEEQRIAESLVGNQSFRPSRVVASRPQRAYAHRSPGG